MQAAPHFNPQDPSVVIAEPPQDAAVEERRASESSIMRPPESFGDSPAKDESMEDGTSPQDIVKAGPGRKSRACNEWCVVHRSTASQDLPD